MSDTQIDFDLSIWDSNRGKIRSKKGGWIIGRGIVNQGFEMMSDFVGKRSYMQVIVFNAIGRMPERRLADWLEAVYICLSWPDPRIWCNHIGALGGTLRTSAVGATAVGMMATDARAYGVKPLLEGLPFIQQALRDFEGGMSIPDIVARHCKRGKPQMMGYARPIAKGDERVPAMERVREELNFPVGKHLQLALDIHDYIYKAYSESININGYVSAFLSDQDYSAEDAYRVFCVLVSSGVTACYVDTYEKPAETFMPLRCDDVDYIGKEMRKVPG